MMWTPCHHPRPAARARWPATSPAPRWRQPAGGQEAGWVLLAGETLTRRGCDWRRLQLSRRERVRGRLEQQRAAQPQSAPEKGTLTGTGKRCAARHRRSAPGLHPGAGHWRRSQEGRAWGEQWVSCMLSWRVSDCPVFHALWVGWLRRRCAWLAQVLVCHRAPGLSNLQRG